VSALPQPPVTLDENGNPIDPLTREAFAFYSLVDKQDRDPANLGFPPMMPIEIVLRTAPVKEICEAYGIDRDEYERLRNDPFFIAAVRKAQEMALKDGWGFRMKALLQAESLLGSSWTLIHSPDTPASVKKDLILGTWRAAGVIEPENKGGATNVGFSISINLKEQV